METELINIGGTTLGAIALFIAAKLANIDATLIRIEQAFNRKPPEAKT